MLPPRYGLTALARSASRNALLLALLPLGFLLVVPLPTPLLSLLLVADLLFSAVVLATLLRARSTAELSTLPTLLLLGALYRLALNLASSRLILTQGDAGEVIESAGRLLTESHWAVGLLLYAVVSLIQWVVINAGSGRVAEVAARFALDALPVRMLALDGDIKAGRLHADEGTRRRAELLAEANWQGAMDGAVRFVRGDATVGLIIAAINLAAGTMLGVMRDGLPFAQSADLYATLAIGDGLVSQIPSLLLSVGAALAVTRSGMGSAPEGVSGRLIAEFLGAPRQFVFAGIWVTAFGFLPGLPLLPFVAVGLPVAMVGGWMLWAGRDTSPVVGEVAELHLPAEHHQRWMAAGISSRQFASRARAHWGFPMPSLRVVTGAPSEPRCLVVWQGSRVAVWRSEAQSAQSLLDECLSRSGELAARTLRSATLQQHLDTMGRSLPTGISLDDATEALRRCLREGLPLLDFERVLEVWETLPTDARTGSDGLAERAREALVAPQLLALAPDGRLAVVLVTPSVEQELRAAQRLGSVSPDGELPPAIHEIVCRALRETSVNEAVCMVVTQDVRRLLAPLVRAQVPGLPLFGHRELRHAGVELHIVSRAVAGVS